MDINAPTTNSLLKTPPNLAICAISETPGTKCSAGNPKKLIPLKNCQQTSIETPTKIIFQIKKIFYNFF